MHATLDDWIRDEGISFSTSPSESFGAAVDRVIESLAKSVDVLGFGEPLHGSEEILIIRNRLFERLVEKHGFTAIAIESSFPRGHAVNEYVAGRGAESYDAIKETGFGHNFGKSDANRQLVDWMRTYNADRSHGTPLQFYGFDSPTEMVGTDSPRKLLRFALEYLSSINVASAEERRNRIEALLGDDATWENPAASFDSAKSIGLSPEAKSLRIETKNLIAELRLLRTKLSEKTDAALHDEALHHAVLARDLLNYHATVARASDTRIADLLSLRDSMMADNLIYIASREKVRASGKVLAFAHNAHLKRGKMKWQMGPSTIEWWPAGAHLNELLGNRYAVIGSGIGTSEAQGIASPEPGTLESRLSAGSGSARFIPTHKGRELPALEIASLATRTASATNASYFAFTRQSLTDFDWLAVWD